VVTQTVDGAIICYGVALCIIFEDGNRRTAGCCVWQGSVWADDLRQQIEL